MGRFFPLLAAIAAVLFVQSRQEDGSPEKRGAVKAAVAEKLVDFGSEILDKQLEHMEAAGEKARSFLHHKIQLDIEPDMTFQSDNANLPEGYHLSATVEDEDEPQHEAAAPAYVYPAGMGHVLMNGCYGRDYQENDPCYQIRRTASYCHDLVDGAAFLGCGFDGNGDFNPDGRKMSLVQRNCANKAIYEGYGVPDAMNVHGVYDTSARMMTYENEEQYRLHLQTESASSGYGFGFNKGVKDAFGFGLEASAKVYLAITDIDIERYEIYMDEVKPTDLSLPFLRDYLNLPVSYFSPGAQRKYHDFLQRWGTSYVKSAKFGGRLEILKVASKEQFSSKLAFSEAMEAEYNSLFFGGGTRSSESNGSENEKQTKFTRSSLSAQGGSHEVATLLTDMYSPSFKKDFLKWLKSVPEFPKAYSFQLGSIVNLVNFRASDLFVEEDIDWGCEGHDLLEDRLEDGTTRWYYISGNSTTKRYCPFADRNALDDALRGRKVSLQTAIDNYLAGEDTATFSKVTIPAIHDCTTEPCNLEWSNVFQLDLRLTTTAMDGRCIYFTAITAGDFFVALATLPRMRSTWYYVKIGTQVVQIFKGSTLKIKTFEVEALSLGDDKLYQYRFVCIYETPESALITVGKTSGSSSEGDVYLSFIDSDPLRVQFYAFGNNKKAVTIHHVRVVPHQAMNIECMGTKTQAHMAYDETKICVPRCHEYCEPMKGCSDPGNPIPSQCHACRFAKERVSRKCLEKCPVGHVPAGQDKECIAFSSTFDIKAIVSNNDRVPPVEVQRPIGMLCLWKKFLGSKPSSAEPNVILRFYKKPDEVILRTVANQSSSVYRGELLSKHKGEILWKLDFNEHFNNREWHHFCLASHPYNSHGTYRLVYVDGQVVNSKFTPRLIIDENESTSLEIFPESVTQQIHLSGLVLSSNNYYHDAQRLYESCLNKAYDDSLWSSLSSKIPKGSSLKVQPSSCVRQVDINN